MQWILYTYSHFGELRELYRFRDRDIYPSEVEPPNFRCHNNAILIPSNWYVLLKMPTNTCLRIGKLN
jgi:hypothetical protein